MKFHCTNKAEMGLWLGGDASLWVAFSCHCIANASASPTSHHSY